MRNNFLRSALFTLYAFCIFGSIAFAQSPYNVPIPDYPGNGAEVWEVPTYLNWYLTGSTAGLTFNVQIASDSNFTNLYVNVDTLTSTNYSFTPVNGVTYYWHVRSRNSNNINSLWSPTWSFRGSGNANLFSITPSPSTHGIITPSTVTLITYGQSQTFKVIPDSGYFVSNIYVDNIAVGPDTQYTFTNVTSNHTISTLFSNICTITSSAGLNGNISPLGTNTVTPGSNITYAFTPNTGYHVDSVFVDGKYVDSTSTYTFVNVQAIHTISVTFAINIYYISAAANAGGTISPAGLVAVQYGGSQIFTITASQGYSIQYVTVGNTSIGPAATYNYSFVTHNDSIRAYFVKIRNWYVSNSGQDIPPNDGSISLPFRTYARAKAAAQPGDSIIVDNGVFNEPVFLTTGINVRGSGNTIFPLMFIGSGSSNASVSDLNIYSVSPFSSSGTINIGGGCSYISLNNITVTGLTNTGVEFQADSNITISNLTVTNCLDGLNFYNCKNISLTNVNTSSNILWGTIFNYCINFTVNNLISDNNMPPPPGPPSGTGNGILISNSSKGIFNNTNASFNGNNGLLVLSNDYLNFIGGNFSNNYNGINLNTDPSLSLGIAIPSGASASFNPPLQSLSNFNFSGTVIDTSNIIYNLIVQGYNTATNSIVAPVFNGNILLKNSNVGDLVIQGYVLDPTFNGLDFERSNFSSNAFINISSINGFPLAQPSGVKINNSAFGSGVTFIDLYHIGTNVATQDVDFTNNDFLSLNNPNFVSILIIDSTKFPNASPRPGYVNYSGFNIGSNPAITVSSVLNAYKGATYFVDVNLYLPKTMTFNYLSGRFSFDTTKVKYLSTLSNGLINNAQWHLVIDNSVAGQIGFTGFGIIPLDSTGKLFSFGFQIDSAAGDSIASITCDTSQFTANNANYTFGVTNGTFLYHDLIGSIQQLGDVTLDGVVNMNDFYALLFYLSGSAPITSAQALTNADFNQDGAVNEADLTALYDFINGITPNVASTSGSVSIDNVSYNQTSSATLPVSIANAHNINSLLLTLDYDPALISFNAFSRSINIKGSMVQAVQSKLGEAKFFFNSPKILNGTINPGNLILGFLKNSIPVGSVIKSFYSINGKAQQQGPTFTFGKDGLIVTNVDNASTLPKEFALSQNYPNPFNPTTVINYQLPKLSSVSIKIYNMLGQEVRTLVNEQRPAGSYNITWDGRNNFGEQVSSGAYIYRIVAGSFITAKKMILLK